MWFSENTAHRGAITVLVGIGGLALTLPASAAPGESRPATAATREANVTVEQSLPFADTRDFELAKRGLIARPESVVIQDETGRVVWSLSGYEALIDGTPRPDTVNPSHWRQAQLNMNYGLYEVVPGIYQVRGYDLANLTVVRGETGWIVFDTLTTQETARAAMQLIEEHLGSRPVKAVIYSHTHADHWGGVRGVISQEEVAAGRLRVIAPAGFMHHAIAENVLAGNVMSRRATYQYGILLGRGADGQLDAAIGKSVSTGLITLIPPTDTIEATPTEITVDGVRMVFQYTPGTEAPAEMNTYLPQFEALWMAENCVATVHNLYTLRGAEVRDPLSWSKYINESIELFGAGTEVVFASHSWPRWGRQEAIEYLKKQRDLYGYLHDQTLRLANHGHTMDEIAEMLVIPPALSEVWYNRGYHGTYNHNIKAVYQKYLGWYDGNPANLHPLPPEASAPRYVEFMGGAEHLLEKARAAFERGEYRWVAEVVNHLVFADPGNAAARALQADALEQLGFQAEGAGWRNSYLMAAKELREGVPGGVSARSVSPDVIRSMSVDLVLDYLGVRLNGPRAAGKRMVLNFAFPDLATDYAVTLENSHLSYVRGKRAENADATFTMPRPVLDAILLRQLSLAQALEEGRAHVSGNAARFGELMVLMDDFEFWFDIVTP